MPGDATSKICQSCGRTFSCRAKWKRVWASVKFCSDRCRRSRRRPHETELRAAILGLLASRGRGKTICPSEAARSVAPEGWRDLMEPTRVVARKLVAESRIQMLQRGHVVNPSTARGAFRLRLTHRTLPN